MYIIKNVLHVLKCIDEAGVNYPAGLFDFETDQLLPYFASQIEKTNNINITNNVGATALIMASASDLPELTQLLVTSGADVNLQDCNGYSALVWAGIQGNAEIVTMLIDAGANIFLTMCDMNILEYIVRHTGDIEIVKILLNAAAHQDREKIFNKRVVSIDDGPAVSHFIVYDNKMHINSALLQVLRQGIWYEPHDIIDVLINDNGFNKKSNKEGGIGDIILKFVQVKGYKDIEEKLIRFGIII